MISAGYYSLFRWNLIGEKTFIGFENYRFYLQMTLLSTALLLILLSIR